MPGPLTIRFASDVEPVRKAMTQAAALIADNMGKIARSSAAASNAMQGHWVRAAAQLLGTAGLLKIGFAGAAVTAAAALAQGISSIEKFTEIADSAKKVDVSTTFFQAFLAQAKSLKTEAGDLEQALKNAYKAGQPLFEQQQPIRKRLGEIFESGFTGDFVSQGLKAFDKATTAEQRIRAVVVAMQELESLGLRLGSLDIAEKFFGAAFADNLRQTGKSAKDLLADIDAAARKPDIIKQADIERAKALHDQMQAAKTRLEEALKLTDFLAASGRELYGVWVTIVDVISKAAKGLSEFLSLLPKGQASGISTGTIEQTITTLTTRLADAGLTELQRRGLEDQLRAARAQLAQLDLKRGEGIPAIPPVDTGPPAANVPFPRRRPLAFFLNPPKPESPETSSRDRFEASADAIEKRTAAMEAEVKTIDLGTQARERSKIAAQLEAVAIQINKEAGKENTEVTEEQRKRIDAVADAYGRAAVAIEKAHSPLATFARESANIEMELNKFGASALSNLTDSMADVAMGTKSLSAAVRDMANSIIRDLLRIAIRAAITGPLAKGLLGGLGGLFNFGDEGVNLGSRFAPLPGLGAEDYGYASGGYTGAGGRMQPAGIVHRGEYVFDAAATRRIGVSNLARLHRGFADGGYVSDFAPPRSSLSPHRGSATTFRGGNVIINGNVDSDARVRQLERAMQTMNDRAVREIKAMRSSSHASRTGVGRAL